MKSIKLFATMILATLFFTSCKKDSMGVTVGTQVGPVYVELSWGNTGANGNYYGGIPGASYNTNIFVGYIAAKPNDQNNIPICTKTGVQFCTASCTTAQWQFANDFFMTARSATYPPVRPVLVRVERNYLTTSGDSYYIIAY